MYSSVMCASVLNIPGTDIPYTPAEQLIVESREERVKLFQEIPWQLFTTNTITRPLGLASHYSIWSDYLDGVKSEHRDTVGLLWCREHNPSWDMDLHYHCLWVSNKPVSGELVRSQWLGRAGTSGKPVDIKPCDGNPRVIEYLLKLSDNPYCDWQVSENLELFRPCPVPMDTSQARRRYGRFISRSGANRALAHAA